MEPWLITLVVMVVVQIVGFAYFTGRQGNKLNRATVASEDGLAMLHTLAIAMATAAARQEGVVMQVGDLEIRVRRLEQKKSNST